MNIELETAYYITGTYFEMDEAWTDYPINQAELILVKGIKILGGEKYLEFEFLNYSVNGLDSYKIEWLTLVPYTEIEELNLL